MMGDATNAARGAGACAAFVALQRREGGLKAATAENKCSDPFEKKEKGDRLFICDSHVGKNNEGFSGNGRAVGFNCRV